MNKYQEALNHIRLVCLVNSDDDEDITEYDKRVINNLNILQELVDKAIPKKPINKATYTYDDIPFTALCPNCKENLGYESQNLYKCCYKCGQAIDWSDGSEEK